MKRILGTWGLVACCAVLAVAPVARAQEGAGNALAAVPGEAWAALTVRNAAELDQKLQMLSQQLNVPPMSVLQMAKISMGLMSGVNDAGSVTLMVMPVQNLMMPMDGIVALLPCQDYAALTSMMQLQPAGEGLEGISQAMIANQPSFIADGGGFAVVAPTPGAIQAYLAAKGKPTIGSTWGKYQLDRFAKDDVTLWLNMDGLVASPSFQGMVMPMLMMSPQGAAMQKSLQEMDSVVVSLRIAKEGVFLNLAQSFKPGTDSAKTIVLSDATSESLLRGLPAENYVMAVGMQGSEAAWGALADGIEQTLANPMIAMQLQQSDPTQLERVKQIVTGMVRDMRNVSFSVTALPAGPDGLLGFVKVATVKGDAPGKCTQLGELIGAALAMIPAGPDAEEAKNLMRFTPDAENLAGVPVHHLKFHLDEAKDVTPEDCAKMKKVVGQDGLLFRIAPVGDKHIVATLGGGAARMQAAIAAAKTGAAPLGDNPGIKRVAGLLEAKRSVEGYVAADALMKMIADIGKAVDEPENVPQLAAMDVPAGFVAGPVAEGVGQAEIFAPIELIQAIKDAVMSAQMGGAAPPPSAEEVPAGTAPSDG